MLGIKERSLNAALEYTGLQKIGLPKKWTEASGDIWMKAIVLVRKRNGDHSYMLAERNTRKGALNYTKDFGRLSPLASLVSIHPFLYFDQGRFMPNGEREEIIEQLEREGMERERLEGMDGHELRSLAIAIGMRRQQNNLEKDIKENKETEETVEAKYTSDTQDIIDTMDEHGNFNRDDERIDGLPDEYREKIETEARKRASGLFGKDGFAADTNGQKLAFSDIKIIPQELRKTETTHAKRTTKSFKTFRRQ